MLATQMRVPKEATDLLSQPKAGTVVHACDFSISEAEAGGSSSNPAMVL